MFRHAARAVPWPLLAAAAVLVAAMLRVVEQWPYQTWPLQGVAVGLLAGVAGFAYDEPAADIVDTLPRGLAWRTAARSIAVAGLLAWWVAAVAATRTAYFGHEQDVALQGGAAVLGVVAASAHLRLRGRASPATMVATAAVGTAAYLSLARPAESWLALFPYTAAGAWEASRWWWSAIAVLALGVLVLSLSERRVRL